MMIRNVLFYLAVIPATFFFTLAGSLLFWAPFKVRYRVITAWSHYFIFCAKILGGLRYRVEGLENLPSTHAIVLSNHQSMWETIFMQVLLPPQTWVLKKELFYIPLFGWGLALLEPIAIHRKQFNSAKELMTQGIERLKKGRWVVIFPEGTRVAPNTVGRFSRSAAALAEASQVPVVPIVHNAGAFWPRGFAIKRSGTIVVKIGPMIDSKGKTAIEINDLARDWIAAHLPAP